MMKRFSLQHLPVSRWKNGGGETREICRIAAPQGDFAWRASIATLSQDGAFSLFPGIDRVITLLSGEGVALQAEDWRHALRCHQPFRFTGEQAIVAHLRGGESLDFNIMTDRRYCRSQVEVVHTRATPPADCGGVAYVLSGDWRCDGAVYTPGDGAWWLSHGTCWMPAGDAGALLLTTIHPS
ncbi:HutD/Ves family protein [Musicola paradisiaca]|uniref:HutD family protein n=1 Tax=Musicola paradisiaca (strain Ech703) TaxID=579405 RepID=C6CA08_MUSP7|nr:HutD family protein [Musicola paradisiaca]ACS86430.1 protein of unknown function DUF886 [Musicola paradisiaca Ech703]